mgnify:CR=1 FL=1
MSAEARARFPAGVIRAVTKPDDGKAYGLAETTGANAMFVNTDSVTKAGLDPANAPKTWEALKAASVKIQAATGKPAFELFTQPGTDG